MSTSRLSVELLRLFAKGELSGAQVQSLAAAAWADGWGRTHVLDQRLASAGNHGMITGNILRDIIKAAELADLTCSNCRPYIVQLEDGRSTRMFLPHEIVAAVVDGPDMSQWCLSPEALGGGSRLGKLLTAWSVHPDVKFQGNLNEVCMVGIHCDGVQYTSSNRAGGAKSILVASCNFVSARTDRLRHSRHPLFVIQKSKLCGCGCQGYHTIQKLFAVVAWSFRCLLRGVTPSCRHDDAEWTAHDKTSRLPSGQSIPHGALLQVRGDWEWLVQFCRLRHYNSDRFCWMCQATQSPGPLCFHNFNAAAPHRNTLVTHHDYVMCCNEEEAQVSNVFLCPGTMLQHLGVDSMHAGDLGCFQDAVGSLFWIEISHKGWHRTNVEGLANLNRDLNMFYAANAEQRLSKATPLVMTQIMAKTPGYPFFKAKAAETRHLGDFAWVLAQRHQQGDASRRPFSFRAGTRMAGHAFQHLGHLVAMFTGMRNYFQACSAIPFSDDDCKRSMYDFLQNFKALHDIWRAGVPDDEQGALPFHLRPKAHLLQHLVEDKVPLWGSPASFWCYRDEDYIGTVKSIAKKTKHPTTIELRILEKMMIWTKISSLDHQ